MPSIIGEAVGEVISKFKALPLFRDVGIRAYYEALRTEKDRNDYIRRYEKFWFEALVFDDWVENISFLAKRIEALRPGLSGSPANSGNVSGRELLCNWKLVFSEVYTLIKLLRKAHLIEEREIQDDYRELYYIYLLRNDFVQHPSFDYPFERLGLTWGYKDDSRFLSYVTFGPPSGGLAVYLEHYQHKSGVSPDREWGKVLAENKSLFLEHGGWKNLVNKNVEAPLKGWGLPEVDQERFAEELLDLFEKKVFPHLSLRIEEAEQDNVISGQARSVTKATGAQT